MNCCCRNWCKQGCFWKVTKETRRIQHERFRNYQRPNGRKLHVYIVSSSTWTHGGYCTGRYTGWSLAVHGGQPKYGNYIIFIWDSTRMHHNEVSLSNTSCSYSSSPLSCLLLTLTLITWWLGTTTWSLSMYRRNAFIKIVHVKNLRT